MKIGVVSDTHGQGFPKQMVDDFKTVDLIVHLGDFCSGKDLRALKKINKVRAVCGNMDEMDICQTLPVRDVLEVEGARIGLCHGEGAPSRVLSFVKNVFKNDKLDAVIFGHSHMPYNELIDGVLYFNPGSPTDTVRPPYCSYGILQVNNGKVSGKIIKVNDVDG
jgi:putative phosphoesterase